MLDRNSVGSAKQRQADFLTSLYPYITHSNFSHETLLRSCANNVTDLPHEELLSRLAPKKKKQEMFSTSTYQRKFSNRQSEADFDEIERIVQEAGSKRKHPFGTVGTQWLYSTYGEDFKSSDSYKNGLHDYEDRMLHRLPKNHYLNSVWQPNFKFPDEVSEENEKGEEIKETKEEQLAESSIDAASNDILVVENNENPSLVDILPQESEQTLVSLDSLRRNMNDFNFLKPMTPNTKDSERLESPKTPQPMICTSPKLFDAERPLTAFSSVRSPVSTKGSLRPSGVGVAAYMPRPKTAMYNQLRAEVMRKNNTLSSSNDFESRRKLLPSLTVRPKTAVADAKLSHRSKVNRTMQDGFKTEYKHELRIATHSYK
jgi:hypothetical protein